MRNDIDETRVPGQSDLAQAVFGHFDGVFGRVAGGWAYLPSSPETRIAIQVKAGERVVAEGVAERFREDLLHAGIGDGRYSFQCLLPIELFDGRQYSLSVQVKGTGQLLDGGPHTVNQKLLSLQEAFSPSAAAAAPPLTDFQVAMLHGLTRVCETLVEQGRVLQSLAESRSDHELPPEDARAAARSRESRSDAHRYGPLVDEFRRCAPKTRDVIVFSIIDWNFRIQRPQHLAANMAKLGCRVTYVSVHLEQATSQKGSFFVRSKPAQNVFEVVLRCSAPVPSVYAGFSDPRQIQDLCGGVEKMMAVLGIKAPIAMLQYPTWLPVANSIPGACIVFDCLDHLAGFGTTGPEVVALEEQLVASADAVVTSSQYLYDMVSRVRPTTIIRNAAEVEFFATPSHRPKDFGKGPVIGYYGAIAEWFDVDLVASAARERSDWTFVLVGSTEGADVRRLEALPNVHLVGEVPYNDIPDYLYAFNCCIIPFKLTELIKATNPVKIYEFFAAGKPVVATDMPELRLVPQDLVRIADTPAAFVREIRQALEEDDDKAARRRLWAMGNSWVGRTRTYLTYIDQAFPKVSVVVLCYNGLDLTKACLQSVEDYSSYPNLEIICVDNNSTDGTRDYLGKWSAGKPNVKIVLNDENLGFSGGNNVGMAQASGEFIILLNNDTYVTEGWVRDLIRPMMLDPAIGMTGPVTNMIGNEQKLAVQYSNMGEMASVARKATLARKRNLFETNNLAFFCVAIPRRVIDRVGLLDTDFGLGFFEDDDYCRRVTQAGYRLVVVDGVFVHHHSSGSFGKMPEERQRLLNENLIRFERKWGAWTPHSYRNEVGFGE